MKKRKIYIPTPLYYVNAKPHIGHSYTQIICDTAARFHKQCGEEVFFMTGTDEHGEKIEKATLEAGFKKGQEKKFVDTIVPHFKELWKKLDIEYDRFIRTTDEVHEETVKKVLSILYEKGKIYKKLYKGWFCTPCEMFWSHVHAPDGICPDCKRNLEKLNEENYIFKTSEYQNELIEHIKKTNVFILPDMRKNEVLSFLEKNELQDLCISRPKTRLSWGIELPFDKNFVTYVWFDALINYISGIGYLDDRKRFDSLWPDAIHVIGKDILRHHAIYWPIMLLAIDEKPPKHIFTHGWWMIEGEKMSKSRGNVVSPDDIVHYYGADSLRLSEMFMGPLEAVKPWSMDGVNGVRGFLDRAWRMTIDERAEDVQLNTAVQDVEPTAEQNRMLHKTIKAVTDDLDQMAFNTAIARMMEFTNFFLKEDVRPKSCMETFMLLLSPFAPHVAEELWQALGQGSTLAFESWPDYDEELIKEDTVEVPVQVNGKLRARIQIPTEADRSAQETAARANPKIAELLKGKTIAKVIVVPGRMVNFVVK